MMAIRATALLVLALAGSAKADVTVRYLANEAYLVSNGETAVLLDAFVPEPYSGYAALEPADWRAMLSGEGEFANVVAAVASHEHADHIQPGAASRFLAAHADTRLFTTPAAADLLEDVPADRVTRVLPDYGDSTTHAAGAVRLAFLRLAHRAERENDVQNLGVIVEMDGARILHLGDAYPETINFEPFDLPARGIDVALVPEWFFLEEYFPDGEDLVREHIAAGRVVMTHYAMAELEARLAGFRQRFPDVGHLVEPGSAVTVE